MVASVTTAGSRTDARRAVLSPMYVASCALSHVENVAKKPMTTPRRKMGLSGNRLEASVKGSLSFYDALQGLLPNSRFLRLGRLVEDLILGLLVLQHTELGTDPRLQIENRFLICGGRNGGDQALNPGESTARVRERLVRQRLLHGAPLTRCLNELLISRRQRG